MEKSPKECLAIAIFDLIHISKWRMPKQTKKNKSLTRLKLTVAASGFDHCQGY